MHTVRRRCLLLYRCICLFVIIVSLTKRLNWSIEMPFGLWTPVGPRNHALGGGVDPRREGVIRGCSPKRNALDCVNAEAARGCRLVHRGQRITASARLQNWLSRREGDKCRGDAAFHQSSLTTCFIQFLFFNEHHQFWISIWPINMLIISLLM